jgi:hypothetical protein
MAILLLVAASDAGEPNVGPAAAERLRQFGISRISLLRDGSTTGVVLEGWAFDPAQADEATRAIYPGGSAGVRAFHEIEHVAVSGPRSAHDPTAPTRPARRPDHKGEEP